MAVYYQALVSELVFELTKEEKVSLRRERERNKEPTHDRMTTTVRLDINYKIICHYNTNESKGGSLREGKKKKKKKN